MSLARSVVLAALSLLGASHATAQVGTVTRARKINDVHGHFSGQLLEHGKFGFSLARVGDLDGDGIDELAVGAPYAPDGWLQRGVVWILFLESDGSVRRHSLVAEGEGGFLDPLGDHTYFGYTLAEIGDLDGDGTPDLAVGGHGTANTPWPGGLWILFLTPDGAVRDFTRIDVTDPVFAPRLRDDFCYSIAGLGDVDGDGVADLAVGTPYDDDGPSNDGGAIWILRLHADGSAKAATKISQAVGGFPGRSRILGGSLASLGDLNGDGQPELAAASSFPLPRGSLWVLSLLEDHTVGRATQLFPEDLGRADQHFYYVGAGDVDRDGRRELFAASADLDGLTVNFVGDDGRPATQVLVGRSLPELGAVERASLFGLTPVVLGDLDKDGTVEVAIGAPRDGETGFERGAVWIVSVVADRVRTGRGNLHGALAQKVDPALGTPWRTTLDCRETGAGLAHLLVSDLAIEGTRTPVGTWLVAGGGHRLVVLAASHDGEKVPFEVPVPADPALVGLAVHAQGLCDGVGARRLSDALDVLVGRF